MREEELSRIAQLGLADGTPQARALEPEVRSGVSFTFGGAAIPATVNVPRFQVVWFYTVKPADRGNFQTQIAAFESQATPAVNGVTYRGTYSVTISAAAPQYEYRTIWGLDSLAALQDLNNLLHGAAAGGPLRSWLDLIAADPAMRSEIMGRTFTSAVVPGT